MTTRHQSPLLVACCRSARPASQPRQSDIVSLLVTRHASRVTHTAFSLIEILVTVTLLSVIVLGLMVMFNQTQLAFRSSMTQTDVLESGRAVMDLLARELEQLVPANLDHATNFYARYIPPPAGPANPLIQELPGYSEMIPPGSGGRMCWRNFSSSRDPISFGPASAIGSARWI
jgi:prepilin-type N-terminal cleavage/methylation domain-containing protein